MMHVGFDDKFSALPFSNWLSAWDVGGGATGSEEFDVMSPLHLTPFVHAVTLAGGSAFGLEAASGVRRYLEKKGVGFAVGTVRLPVSSAWSLDAVPSSERLRMPCRMAARWR